MYHCPLTAHKQTLAAGAAQAPDGGMGRIHNEKKRYLAVT